jgi:Flp pilus assembly protein TadD
MALRSAGRGEEAASEFREIARRRPEYVPTYLMLGQTLEGLGREDEAARAYQDGMEIAAKADDGHARSELEQALGQVRARGAER